MRNLMKLRRSSAIAVFVLLTLFATACDTWERITFQTLSASQAVINQAQADYESGTIPKTVAAFTLITQAKVAQTTAVNAMVVYEGLKANAGSASALSLQQQVVTAALVTIPQFVVNIKALYAPATGTVKP